MCLGWEFSEMELEFSGNSYMQSKDDLISHNFMIISFSLTFFPIFDFYLILLSYHKRWPIFRDTITPVSYRIIL